MPEDPSVYFNYFNEQAVLNDKIMKGANRAVIPTCMRQEVLNCTNMTLSDRLMPLESLPLCFLARYENGH